MHKHNFSAGPAILPPSVFQQASKAVVDYEGIGLSILEISHRSKEFKAILEEAIQTPKELLHLPDNYEVLYLTGGASSQFFMSAMNLLRSDATAAYIDTGSWSSKAIKEAKKFGRVDIIASSKDRDYRYIPKDYAIPEGATYLHITSNNTIYGTQYHTLPETNVPLVCDMSSDFLSRPIDVKRFGIIYAGAQKNLGPAGTTLVIVRKDLLGKVDREIPTILDYKTHIEKQSAFNTPPVFPIYVSLLTLRWLKEQGGVEKIAEYNQRKADLFYSTIDELPLFQPHVVKEDRSIMNATFSLAEPELERAFLEACEAENCVGVKGHRSVGGFRASMYNAMPLQSVEVLTQVMHDFAQKHG